METRTKFNPMIHEIISIDCISLYTSVNVNRVIEEVIREIYKSPNTYFKYDPEEVTNLGGKPKVPLEQIFRNFLFQILLKFNYFTTVAGHYQQLNGLSMGSSLSPLLANFYVNLVEQKIIKKEIENGAIVAYCRYVDDGYCIIRKDSKNRILNTLNNFDPTFLQFTHENMTNNTLTYLDTKIYLNDNNIPEIKKYRKDTASEVVINFRESICAKKYKLSTLQGDIFRCHYTCSTETDREHALKELTELYVRNEYPRKLVENTIREIKGRNFESNGNKGEYQKLRKESPERFFTLCIPYTSQRCEKVMSKIIRLLKKKKNTK